jgi:deoxyribose-phosphate aldolase
MNNNDSPNLEEENSFSFSDRVDLHCMDLYTPLSSVVAVAAEHNFRAIVVPIGRIEELVKAINKPDLGDKKIVSVAVFDYPYGFSSLDIRTYSIFSAKEKGAKEIEIVAPYYYIVREDFIKIVEDVKSLIVSANKADIKLRYVLDQNSGFIDDGFRIKLYRALSQAKVPMLSTSLGHFDEKIDHGDNIIRMRSMKSKINCPIKAFIDTTNPSDLALYPRAGADTIGLNWNQAPHLVYEYENIVQKKS